MSQDCVQSEVRLTDVRVVDLGEKADLWWGHGVLFRQEQLQPEHTV